MQGKGNRQRLEKERQQLARLFAGLAVAAVTGLVTYLEGGHGIWQQWTYLVHTAAGIFLALIIAPYAGRHFLRTLGLRRPLTVASGLVALLITLVLAVTGLHIAVAGQAEKWRWIYNWHVITGVVVLGGLVLHLVAHRLTLPRRRREEPARFASITPHAYRKSLVALVATAGLVAAASLLTGSMDSPYRDQAVVTPYGLPYGSHPFRPSQTETSTGSFLDPRRVGMSETCGACHAAIVAEWQGSLHAKAASDQSYQTNVNLLAKKKGMAATRYCEGCHAPAALIGGVLAEGGRLDTRWHMKDGVSCLSCHGIDQVIHTNGVASFRFRPPEPYLFEGHTNVLAAKIRNFLIKIQPRQHRRDMGEDLLADPVMCATCHAQFMDEDMNDWGWVKMQDEYSAWLNSPYSGHSEHLFARSEIRRCHDCHMPLAEMEDPSASAKGRVRSHRFPGANTAIPWFDGDVEQLEVTRRFLQENKVRLSIERPNRIHSVESDMPISPQIKTRREAPGYFYAGENANINLIVTNTGVGHNFPGGTTDINQAWIYVKVTDATQRIVFESGGMDDSLRVDPDAYFYQSIPIDRHGAHVWKHDLFNMVGDSYKNVVRAGESDIVRYEFRIPTWVKPPMIVQASLKYRKFNQRYAEWALGTPGIRLPVVEVARDAIELPVRERPEAFHTDAVAPGTFPRSP